MSLNTFTNELGANKPPVVQVPDNTARAQAIAQAQSIIAMVTALHVDYDRLEELRAAREDWALDHFVATVVDMPSARAMWATENPEEAEELKDLEEAANGCADQYEAHTAIQEDPLSVEVRSGWCSVGDGMEAYEEFRIVLCTGGHRVEILGELRYGAPARAWIAYQSWGESGELHGYIEQDTLLTYCREFFG